MEKSVKNAVFKGFPVLMESGPLGSKQYSQTTNKETNNFLSSYFKEIYLVSKCMSKRVADESAIGLPMGENDFFNGTEIIYSSGGKLFIQRGLDLFKNAPL